MLAWIEPSAPTYRYLCTRISPWQGLPTVVWALSKLHSEETCWLWGRKTWPCHDPVTSRLRHKQPWHRQPPCPGIFSHGCSHPFFHPGLSPAPSLPMLLHFSENPFLSLFFSHLRLRIGANSIWKSSLIHATYIFSSLNYKVTTCSLTIESLGPKTLLVIS